MKRLSTLLVASLLIGATAQAATVRDNCGCGLGTMALGDLEPTLIVQIGATSLNGISGNQTFGITSGTLECEPNTGFVSNQRVIEYVNDNIDHLALDMAEGQGDSLDALADLMEIPADDRADLYTSLQSQFDNIFATENVTGEQIVSQIAAIL